MATRNTRTPAFYQIRPRRRPPPSEPCARQMAQHRGILSRWGAVPADRRSCESADAVGSSWSAGITVESSETCGRFVMKRESELSDTRVVGHRMIDDHGTVVGRGNDVIYGDRSSEPEWAVVGTGWWRTERFVPLHEAYLATDGKVVVPYDKAIIKHAPRAGDHLLVPAVRAALAAYYGHY